MLSVCFLSAQTSHAIKLNDKKITVPKKHPNPFQNPHKMSFQQPKWHKCSIWPRASCCRMNNSSVRFQIDFQLWKQMAKFTRKHKIIHHFRTLKKEQFVSLCSARWDSFLTFNIVARNGREEERTLYLHLRNIVQLYLAWDEMLKLCHGD